MEAKLYIERWLLTLKLAAESARLESHVRALDFKGGKRLAFHVRRGNDALEFRYRKRRTGARMLVASTSAEIVGRTRDIHQRVLAEHRKLLENGFRRFLRRSIRLLEALESALYRDAELLQRTLLLIRDIPEAAGSRPAALLRPGRTHGRRYEVLPAVALWQRPNLQFMGLQDGRLVDLCDFMPIEKTSEITKRIRRHRYDRTSRDRETITPADTGVELVYLAGELADSLATHRTTPAPLATADPIAIADVAADGMAADACAGNVGLTETCDIMAEQVAEAGDITAEGIAAGGAALESVGGIGESAAEVLSESGSALSDAACGGIDCGGIDCVPG